MNYRDWESRWQGKSKGRPAVQVVPETPREYQKIQTFQANPLTRKGR
jgi:hypothetical protein